MKHLLTTLILLVASLTAAAQQDLEYKMEIGGGVGLSTYLGDFNSSFTSDMQPMASIMLRRVLNPYMSFRADLAYMGLKGNSRNSGTYYPGLEEEPYSFSTSMGSLDLTCEYNFLPYGTGHDYRGAKRVVPFIFGGFGLNYASCNSNGVFTANVPLGFGVKYKAGERINVGLEYAFHFSLSDKLDAAADPYGIKSSGLFKNTDCYTALQLSVTYSFMPKCRTCHNDRD